MKYYIKKRQALLRTERDYGVQENSQNTWHLARIMKVAEQF